jgi:HK97 family phage major capsid protein
VAVPHSLSFFFKVSRELLMDAPNINAALTQAIAQAFAKELDRAGLIGTGTAPEPRGLLNTPGVLSITNGTNGASLATTRYANMFSGVQALLQGDAPMPTAFVVSPRTKVGIAALQDTTNQPIEVPAMLGNIPMIATSQISNALTVGTSTDCTQIFMGDFARMAFMMRETVHIQLADQLYAGTGQIGFFCHVRADVVVQYPKAFAIVTGVRP